MADFARSPLLLTGIHLDGATLLLAAEGEQREARGDGVTTAGHAPAAADCNDGREPTSKPPPCAPLVGARAAMPLWCWCPQASVVQAQSRISGGSSKCSRA